MARDDLTRARRLFRRGRYREVVALLEPQVFMYRTDPDYYYLLGASCLHSRDVDGALSYLQRSVDIEPRGDAQLALAAVHLRRAETERALELYLEVAEGSGAERRRARRALGWIRGLDTPDDAKTWFSSGRISRVMPRPPARIGRWVVIVLTLAAVGTVGAFVIVRPDILALPPGLWTRGEQRVGSEAIVGRASLAAPPSQTATYDLSEKELAQLQTRIGRWFNDGDDNRVRVGLNRIALSNADATTKARFDLVWDYLTTPDFATFRWGPEYDEVAADVQLYRDTFVRWRGRVVNLRVDDDRIRFDFLVNYESGEVLSGVVPAEVPFPILLNGGDAAELIGRLTPRSTEAGTDVFTLEVTSIRRLSVEQQPSRTPSGE